MHQNEPPPRRVCRWPVPDARVNAQRSLCKHNLHSLLLTLLFLRIRWRLSWWTASRLAFGLCTPLASGSFSPCWRLVLLLRFLLLDLLLFFLILVIVIHPLVFRRGLPCVPPDSEGDDV